MLGNIHEVRNVYLINIISRRMFDVAGTMTAAKIVRLERHAYLSGPCWMESSAFYIPIVVCMYGL